LQSKEKLNKDMKGGFGVIIRLLVTLWKYISTKRRWQLLMLLLLMIVSAISEVVSIGAIIPFLGIVTAPEKINNNIIYGIILKILRPNDFKEMVLMLTICFALAAVLAGLIRLLLLWMSTRISLSVGSDISYDMYRRVLYQSYSFHVSSHSSSLISAISAKSNFVIFGVIYPVLNLISGTMMLLVIGAAVMMIDSVMALNAFAGFGFIYGVTYLIGRNKAMQNSVEISNRLNEVVKSLQDGLGGIRDILVDGSQEMFCSLYRNADIRLRLAQGSNAFMAGSPRFVIESVGMVFMALYVYFSFSKNHGIMASIPALGAIALGAQRMLPILQQNYASLTSVLGNKGSLEETVRILKLSMPANGIGKDTDILQYQNEIKVDGVSFRYNENDKWILRDINLVIKKGMTVGIVGTTGSGKSTLLDIVMGLLEPTDGKLQVDGVTITEDNRRSWQKRIAHVPQSIFLSEDTIEENIAFGIHKKNIDKVRVFDSAKKSKIHAEIACMSQKYNTKVGERGIRLSGGQRQRIAIARAMYKDADVIILDEATSALDVETERAVMSDIESLGDDITLLIIAHRVSTLKNCDLVIEISDGMIKRVGGFDEVVCVR